LFDPYTLTVAGSDPLSLAPQWIWHVDRIVENYGRLAASTLRNLAYQTEPMREAVEGGVRGVELDLEVVRPIPDLDLIGQHFRRVLDSLETENAEATDDLVGQSEIEDDIGRLRPARSRATREML